MASMKGALYGAMLDREALEVGGPEGDNGLSGKKLVMDAYGPRVRIGGGAWSVELVRNSNATVATTVMADKTRK